MFSVGLGYLQLTFGFSGDHVHNVSKRVEWPWVWGESAHLSGKFIKRFRMRSFQNRALGVRKPL